MPIFILSFLLPRKVKTIFEGGPEALKAWHLDRRSGFLRPKCQTKSSLRDFGGPEKICFYLISA